MPSPTFWHTVATYCRHIAPVATDVCSQIGHLANAIETARTDLTVVNDVPITLSPFAPEFNSTPSSPTKAPTRKSRTKSVVDDVA